MKKIKRDLDGVYFRVKRGERYEDVCFSDLETDEREEVMSGRDRRWLKSLCNILADSLYQIGEQFDIARY